MGAEQMSTSAWKCLLQRSAVFETGPRRVSAPLRHKKVLVGWCCCVFSLVMIIGSSARCETNTCPSLDVHWMAEGSSPREGVWRRLLISGFSEEDFLSRPLEAATWKTSRLNCLQTLSWCFLMAGIYIPKGFLVRRWVGNELGSPLWALPLFTKFYDLFC